MISEKYLKENIVFSPVQLYNSKSGVKLFFLASAISVMVEWEDGTKEQIDLMDRMQLPMNILNKIKPMVGKVKDLEYTQKQLSKKFVNELVFKTYESVMNTIKAGNMPDRLSEDKKSFNKIYEVKEGSAKI